jgi:hypothetical protein
MVSLMRLTRLTTVMSRGASGYRSSHRTRIPQNKFRTKKMTSFSWRP